MAQKSSFEYLADAAGLAQPERGYYLLFMRHNGTGDLAHASLWAKRFKEGRALENANRKERGFLLAICPSYYNQIEQNG